MITLTRSRSSSSTHTGGEDQLTRYSKFNKKKIDIDLRSHVSYQNLFVFHLPSQWTEDNLKTEFGKFGTIYSTRVARGTDGTSKGYGFVCFKDRHSACQAIMEMHGRYYSGKRLKVSLKKNSEDSHLHAKQFNDYIQSNGVHTELKSIGSAFGWHDQNMCSMKGTNILENSMTNESSPNIVYEEVGLVTYDNPQSAALAVKHTNGKYENQKCLNVYIIKSKDQQNASTSSICVLNVPKHWCKRTLYNRFSQFGAIQRIQVLLRKQNDTPLCLEQLHTQSFLNPAVNTSINPYANRIHSSCYIASSEYSNDYNLYDKVPVALSKDIAYSDYVNQMNTLNDYSQLNTSQVGVLEVNLTSQNTLPFYLMPPYSRPPASHDLTYYYNLSSSPTHTTRAPPPVVVYLANVPNYTHPYTNYPSPLWNQTMN